MKTRLLVLALLLTACFVSAQNTLFDDLIRQGIELHDAGNYKAAIKKYDKALKQHPDSKLALYEIAFSYAMMKKYDESITYGLKALAAKDDDNGIDIMIYDLMGSSYDDMGKPEEAIKLFDVGLSNGEHYLLYYNKGLTYHRMDSLEKALSCYKKALSLNATHPTSNLNAARIYATTGDVVSASLYYIYFMLVEPNTRRTQMAFNEMFAMGEGEIIAYPENDEGASNHILGGGLRATLAIVFKGLASIDPNDHEITPYYKLHYVFQTIHSKKDKVESDPLDDICASYYAPMVIAVCEDGYMELFCRYLTHSFDSESKTWLDENYEKLDGFSIWLNAFGRDKSLTRSSSDDNSQTPRDEL